MGVYYGEEPDNAQRVGLRPVVSLNKDVTVNAKDSE